MILGTQGYPPSGPEWNIVPKDWLAHPPYSRICQIRCQISGEPPHIGSGWHIKKGIIQTAAHVVHGSYLIEINFPGSNFWASAKIVEIPRDYVGQDGKARPCSQSDLATLIFEDPKDLLFTEEFQNLEDGKSYYAIGFTQGQLVEHFGDGQEIGPFIAHNAHTTYGHSGCPVFKGGKLAGIHVGLFSESMKYLQTASVSAKGFKNSAVLF